MGAHAALADEMLAALKGLFEHCAMIQRHWGDGSNSRESSAAIAAAEAVIAKAEQITGNVEITVEGGCVTDVEGLPPGFTYTVKDHDRRVDGDASCIVCGSERIAVLSKGGFYCLAHTPAS